MIPPVKSPSGRIPGARGSLPKCMQTSWWTTLRCLIGGSLFFVLSRRGGKVSLHATNLQRGHTLIDHYAKASGGRSFRAAKLAEDPTFSMRQAPEHIGDYLARVSSRPCTVQLSADRFSVHVQGYEAGQQYLELYRDWELHLDDFVSISHPCSRWVRHLTILPNIMHSRLRIERSWSILALKVGSISMGSTMTRRLCVRSTPSSQLGTLLCTMHAPGRLGSGLMIGTVYIPAYCSLPHLAFCRLERSLVFVSVPVPRFSKFQRIQRGLIDCDILPF